MLSALLIVETAEDLVAQIQHSWNLLKMKIMTLLASECIVGFQRDRFIALHCVVFIVNDIQ